MMEKHIDRLFLLLINLLFINCSNIYVSKNFEYFYLLQLNRDNTFIQYKYYMGLSDTLIGYWTQIKDTIYLKIDSPKIYFSYDSSINVIEQKGKSLDSIYFYIKHKKLKTNFSLICLNNNEDCYYTDSLGYLKLPKINISTITVKNFSCRKRAKYKIKNKQNNIFIIIFNEQIPENISPFLIDPINKYLKKGYILIPIINTKKLSYRYKRIIFGNAKIER